MSITLGERIALYRKGICMSEHELAEDIGVTDNTVIDWENDVCQPDIAKLINLADTFNIPLDELVGRKIMPQDEGSLIVKIDYIKSNGNITTLRVPVAMAKLLVKNSDIGEYADGKIDTDDLSLTQLLDLAMAGNVENILTFTSGDGDSIRLSLINA
jgi:transcriptional regulator with XRE-family HTH domain